MVVGIKTGKVKFDRRKLKRELKRGSIKSLGRAGAFVRAIARRSIRKKGKKNIPALPGDPAKTKGPFKESILFEVDKAKTEVVIGPTADIMDNVMKAHEFGGRFRDERFKKRPTMGPALEKATPQLPRFWAKSIR